MARYKETNRKQGQFVPVIFDEQILPGTIEHAICDIIDNHMDLSMFDSKYKNDHTGRPAIAPAILLKIILVCYSKGIFKSRKMENTVKTNIQLMAVAEGMTPDHSTIAAFVSTMGSVINDLFTSVLIRCAQLDLIGGEVFALDGCKLSSNAVKDKSGTFKELEKKKEKLKKMLDHIIEQHIAGDIEKAKLEKQKKEYEYQIKQISDFMETHEPKKGSRGTEKKSNITDNESEKMISSHGMIQGYNGLACVDSKNQVIVSAEAFGQGNEGNLLPKMMENTKENLGKTGENKTLKKNGNR
jgi:transposase